MADTKAFDQMVQSVADNPMGAVGADLRTKILRGEQGVILPVLLAGKESKKMTFAQIGEAIGRNEVAVAAIFYGQSTATEADAAKLAEVLGLDHQLIAPALLGFPDRGKLVDMPPREPMIYRLYEIVQNYGYAYKAVINEKFGDGIMSAISFSTTVEKETDEKGDWVVIRLRGKWLPFTRF